MKSLKIFTSCENCPDNHLKAEKNRVRKAIFLLFAVLCFLSLTQIWWYEFFFEFYWQALGRTQICLMVQQILGNSTEGNVTNFTWKIPIFFVAKHCVIEWKFAKIGILACIDFWIMDHAYSFGMFILDLQNSWTQALLVLVALYSLVIPWKIIRYIPLSGSLRGILASIIVMLQYGKYNSHSACHSGYYCCKNKNYSYLPCLQNKHSLRPCANVYMSTTRVPCSSL